LLADADDVVGTVLDGLLVVRVACRDWRGISEEYRIVAIAVPFLTTGVVRCLMMLCDGLHGRPVAPVRD
jgi:hypothetical protein